jgi:hypothetical protein
MTLLPILLLGLAIALSDLTIPSWINIMYLRCGSRFGSRSSLLRWSSFIALLFVLLGQHRYMPPRGQLKPAGKIFFS